MQLKAHAPGSMMLLGEYGVLYGKQALVCAIDKRITVTLTPRDDHAVIVHSDLHGDYQTSLLDLPIASPYPFVMGALKQYQARLKRGCDIHIESGFSDKIGFGSSAAVTVATLAAIVTWQNIRVTPLDLVRQGRNVIRLVQGVGSGADVAASVFGGIVSYRAQALSAEKFSLTHPITALYAGYKTKTADAIKIVQKRFASHPQLFRELCNAIGQCAAEGMQVLRREDWQGLGLLMNIQQGLMESLGVSTPQLHQMIETLRQQKNMMGAKISGSGLGDCVIGLGEVAADFTCDVKQQNTLVIPVQMTLMGVQSEKI